MTIERSTTDKDSDVYTGGDAVDEAADPIVWNTKPSVAWTDLVPNTKYYVSDVAAFERANVEDPNAWVQYLLAFRSIIPTLNVHNNNFQTISDDVRFGIQQISMLRRIRVNAEVAKFNMYFPTDVVNLIFTTKARRKDYQLNIHFCEHGNVDNVLNTYSTDIVYTYDAQQETFDLANMTGVQIVTQNDYFTNYFVKFSYRNVSDAVDVISGIDDTSLLYTYPFFYRENSNVIYTNELLKSNKLLLPTKIELNYSTPEFLSVKLRDPQFGTNVSEPLYSVNRQYWTTIFDDISNITTLNLFSVTLKFGGNVENITQLSTGNVHSISEFSSVFYEHGNLMPNSNYTFKFVSFYNWISTGTRSTLDFDFLNYVGTTSHGAIKIVPSKFDAFTASDNVSIDVHGGVQSYLLDDDGNVRIEFSNVDFYTESPNLEYLIYVNFDDTNGTKQSYPQHANINNDFHFVCNISGLNYFTDYEIRFTCEYANVNFQNGYIEPLNYSPIVMDSSGPVLVGLDISLGNLEGSLLLLDPIDISNGTFTTTADTLTFSPNISGFVSHPNITDHYTTDINISPHNISEVFHFTSSNVNNGYTYIGLLPNTIYTANVENFTHRNTNGNVSSIQFNLFQEYSFHPIRTETDNVSADFNTITPFLLNDHGHAGFVLSNLSFYTEAPSQQYEIIISLNRVEYGTLTNEITTANVVATIGNLPTFEINETHLNSPLPYFGEYKLFFKYRNTLYNANVVDSINGPPIEFAFPNEKNFVGNLLPLPTLTLNATGVDSIQLSFDSTYNNEHVNLSNVYSMEFYTYQNGTYLETNTNYYNNVNLPFLNYTKTALIPNYNYEIKVTSFAYINGNIQFESTPISANVYTYSDNVSFSYDTRSTSILGDDATMDVLFNSNISFNYEGNKRYALNVSFLPTSTTTHYIYVSVVSSQYVFTPALTTFVKGDTYIFDNGQNKLSHPLYFLNNDDFWDGIELDPSVLFSPDSNGITEVTITETHEPIEYLYAHCQNHVNMIRTFGIGLETEFANIQNYVDIIGLSLNNSNFVPKITSDLNYFRDYEVTLCYRNTIDDTFALTSAGGNIITDTFTINGRSPLNAPTFTYVSNYSNIAIAFDDYIPSITGITDSFKFAINLETQSDSRNPTTANDLSAYTYIFTGLYPSRTYTVNVNDFAHLNASGNISQVPVGSLQSSNIPTLFDNVVLTPPTSVTTFLLNDNGDMSVRFDGFGFTSNIADLSRYEVDIRFYENANTYDHYTVSNVAETSFDVNLNSNLNFFTDYVYEFHAYDVSISGSRVDVLDALDGNPLVLHNLANIDASQPMNVPQFGVNANFLDINVKFDSLGYDPGIDMSNLTDSFRITLSLYNQTANIEANVDHHYFNLATGLTNYVFGDGILPGNEYTVTMTQFIHYDSHGNVSNIPIGQLPDPKNITTRFDDLQFSFTSVASNSIDDQGQVNVVFDGVIFDKGDETDANNYTYNIHVFFEENGNTTSVFKHESNIVNENETLIINIADFTTEYVYAKHDYTIYFKYMKDDETTFYEFANGDDYVTTTTQRLFGGDPFLSPATIYVTDQTATTLTIRLADFDFDSNFNLIGSNSYTANLGIYLSDDSANVDYNSNIDTWASMSNLGGWYTFTNLVPYSMYTVKLYNFEHPGVQFDSFVANIETNTESDNISVSYDDTNMIRSLEDDYANIATITIPNFQFSVNSDATNKLYDISVSIAATGSNPQVLTVSNIHDTHQTTAKDLVLNVHDEGKYLNYYTDYEIVLTYINTTDNVFVFDLNTELEHTLYSNAEDPFETPANILVADTSTSSFKVYFDNFTQSAQNDLYKANVGIHLTTDSSNIVAYHEDISSWSELSNSTIGWHTFTNLIPYKEYAVQLFEFEHMLDQSNVSNLQFVNVTANTNKRTLSDNVSATFDSVNITRSLQNELANIANITIPDFQFSVTSDATNKLYDISVSITEFDYSGIGSTVGTPQHLTVNNIHATHQTTAKDLVLNVHNEEVYLNYYTDYEIVLSYINMTDNVAVFDVYWGVDLEHTLYSNAASFFTAPTSLIVSGNTATTLTVYMNNFVEHPVLFGGNYKSTFNFNNEEISNISTWAVMSNTSGWYTFDNLTPETSYTIQLTNFEHMRDLETVSDIRFDSIYANVTKLTDAPTVLLIPTFNIDSISHTSFQVTVEDPYVPLIDDTTGTYTLQIEITNGPNIEFKNISNVSGLTHTFSNLLPGNEYQIGIVDFQHSSEDVDTESLPFYYSPNITTLSYFTGSLSISFDPTTTSLLDINGNVSVTLTNVTYEGTSDKYNLLLEFFKDGNAHSNITIDKFNNSMNPITINNSNPPFYIHDDYTVRARFLYNQDIVIDSGGNIVEFIPTETIDPGPAFFDAPSTMQVDTKTVETVSLILSRPLMFDDSNVNHVLGVEPYIFIANISVYDGITTNYNSSNVLNFTINDLVPNTSYDFTLVDFYIPNSNLVFDNFVANVQNVITPSDNVSATFDSVNITRSLQNELANIANITIPDFQFSVTSDATNKLYDISVSITEFDYSGIGSTVGTPQHLTVNNIHATHQTTAKDLVLNVHNEEVYLDYYTDYEIVLTYKNTTDNVDVVDPLNFPLEHKLYSNAEDPFETPRSMVQSSVSATTITIHLDTFTEHLVLANSRYTANLGIHISGDSANIEYYTNVDTWANMNNTISGWYTFTDLIPNETYDIKLVDFEHETASSLLYDTFQANVDNVKTASDNVNTTWTGIRRTLTNKTGRSSILFDGFRFIVNSDANGSKAYDLEIQISPYDYETSTSDNPVKTFIKENIHSTHSSPGITLNINEFTNEGTYFADYEIIFKYLNKTDGNIYVTDTNGIALENSGISNAASPFPTPTFTNIFKSAPDEVKLSFKFSDPVILYGHASFLTQDDTIYRANIYVNNPQYNSADYTLLVTDTYGNIFGQYASTQLTLANLVSGTTDYEVSLLDFNLMLDNENVSTSFVFDILSTSKVNFTTQPESVSITYAAFNETSRTLTSLSETNLTFETFIFNTMNEHTRYNLFIEFTGNISRVTLPTLYEYPNIHVPGESAEKGDILFANIDINYHETYDITFKYKNAATDAFITTIEQTYLGQAGADLISVGYVNTDITITNETVQDITFNLNGLSATTMNAIEDLGIDLGHYFLLRFEYTATIESTETTANLEANVTGYALGAGLTNKKIEDLVPSTQYTITLVDLTYTHSDRAQFTILPENSPQATGNTDIDNIYVRFNEPISRTLHNQQAYISNITFGRFEFVKADNTNKKDYDLIIYAVAGNNTFTATKSNISYTHPSGLNPNDLIVEKNDFSGDLNYFTDYEIYFGFKNITNNIELVFNDYTSGFVNRYTANAGDRLTVPVTFTVDTTNNYYNKIVIKTIDFTEDISITPATDRYTFDIVVYRMSNNAEVTRVPFNNTGTEINGTIYNNYEITANIQQNTEYSVRLENFVHVNYISLEYDTSNMTNILASTIAATNIVASFTGTIDRTLEDQTGTIASFTFNNFSFDSGGARDDVNYDLVILFTPSGGGGGTFTENVTNIQAKVTSDTATTTLVVPQPGSSLNNTYDFFEEYQVVFKYRFNGDGNFIRTTDDSADLIHPTDSLGYWLANAADPIPVPISFDIANVIATQSEITVPALTFSLDANIRNAITTDSYNFVLYAASASALSGDMFNWDFTGWDGSSSTTITDSISGIQLSNNTPNTGSVRKFESDISDPTLLNGIEYNFKFKARIKMSEVPDQSSIRFVFQMLNASDLVGYKIQFYDHGFQTSRQDGVNVNFSWYGVTFDESGNWKLIEYPPGSGQYINSGWRHSITDWNSFHDFECSYEIINTADADTSSPTYNPNYNGGSDGSGYGPNIEAWTMRIDGQLVIIQYPEMNRWPTQRYDFTSDVTKFVLDISDTSTEVESISFGVNVSASQDITSLPGVEYTPFTNLTSTEIEELSNTDRTLFGLSVNTAYNVGISNFVHPAGTLYWDATTLTRVENILTTATIIQGYTGIIDRKIANQDANIASFTFNNFRFDSQGEMSNGVKYDLVILFTPYIDGILGTSTFPEVVSNIQEKVSNDDANIINLEVPQSGSSLDYTYGYFEEYKVAFKYRFNGDPDFIQSGGFDIRHPSSGGYWTASTGPYLTVPVTLNQISTPHNYYDRVVVNINFNTNTVNGVNVTPESNIYELEITVRDQSGGFVTSNIIQDTGNNLHGSNYNAYEITDPNGNITEDTDYNVVLTGFTHVGYDNLVYDPSNWSNIPFHTIEMDVSNIEASFTGNIDRTLEDQDANIASFTFNNFSFNSDGTGKKFDLVILFTPSNSVSDIFPEVVSNIQDKVTSDTATTTLVVSDLQYTYGYFEQYQVVFKYRLNGDGNFIRTTDGSADLIHPTDSLGYWLANAGDDLDIPISLKHILTPHNYYDRVVVNIDFNTNTVNNVNVTPGSDRYELEITVRDHQSGGFVTSNIIQDTGDNLHGSNYNAYEITDPNGNITEDTDYNVVLTRFTHVDYNKLVYDDPSNWFQVSTIEVSNIEASFTGNIDRTMQTDQTGTIEKFTFKNFSFESNGGRDAVNYDLVILFTHAATNNIFTEYVSNIQDVTTPTELVVPQPGSSLDNTYSYFEQYRVVFKYRFNGDLSYIQRGDPLSDVYHPTDSPGYWLANAGEDLNIPIQWSALSGHNYYDKIVINIAFTENTPITPGSDTYELVITVRKVNGEDLVTSDIIKDTGDKLNGGDYDAYEITDPDGNITENTMYNVVLTEFKHFVSGSQLTELHYSSLSNIQFTTIEVSNIEANVAGNIDRTLEDKDANIASFTFNEFSFISNGASTKYDLVIIFTHANNIFTEYISNIQDVTTTNLVVPQPGSSLDNTYNFFEPYQVVFQYRLNVNGDQEDSRIQRGDPLVDVYHPTDSPGYWFANAGEDLNIPIQWSALSEHNYYDRVVVNIDFNTNTVNNVNVTPGSDRYELEITVRDHQSGGFVTSNIIQDTGDNLHGSNYNAYEITDPNGNITEDTDYNVVLTRFTHVNNDNLVYKDSTTQSIPVKTIKVSTIQANVTGTIDRTLEDQYANIASFTFKNFSFSSDAPTTADFDLVILFTPTSGGGGGSGTLTEVVSNIQDVTTQTDLVVPQPGSGLNNTYDFFEEYQVVFKYMLNGDLIQAGPADLQHPTDSLGYWLANAADPIPVPISFETTAVTVERFEITVPELTFSLDTNIRNAITDSYNFVLYAASESALSGMIFNLDSLPARPWGQVGQVVTDTITGYQFTLETDSWWWHTITDTAILDGIDFNFKFKVRLKIRENPTSSDQFWFSMRQGTNSNDRSGYHFQIYNGNAQFGRVDTNNVWYWHGLSRNTNGANVTQGWQTHWDYSKHNEFEYTYEFVESTNTETYTISVNGTQVYEDTRTGNPVAFAINTNEIFVQQSDSGTHIKSISWGLKNVSADITTIPGVVTNNFINKSSTEIEGLTMLDRTLSGLIVNTTYNVGITNFVHPTGTLYWDATNLTQYNYTTTADFDPPSSIKVLKPLIQATQYTIYLTNISPYYTDPPYDWTNINELTATINGTAYTDSWNNMSNVTSGWKTFSSGVTPDTEYTVSLTDFVYTPDASLFVTTNLPIDTNITTISYSISSSIGSGTVVSRTLNGNDGKISTITLPAFSVTTSQSNVVLDAIVAGHRIETLSYSQGTNFNIDVSSLNPRLNYFNNNDIPIVIEYKYEKPLSSGNYQYMTNDPVNYSRVQDSYTDSSNLSNPGGPTTITVVTTSTTYNTITVRLSGGTNIMSLYTNIDDNFKATFNDTSRAELTDYVKTGTYAELVGPELVITGLHPNTNYTIQLKSFEHDVSGGSGITITQSQPSTSQVSTASDNVRLHNDTSLNVIFALGDDDGYVGEIQYNDINGIIVSDASSDYTYKMQVYINTSSGNSFTQIFEIDDILSISNIYKYTNLLNLRSKNVRYFENYTNKVKYTFINTTLVGNIPVYSDTSETVLELYDAPYPPNDISVHTPPTTVGNIHISVNQIFLDGTTIKIEISNTGHSFLDSRPSGYFWATGYTPNDLYKLSITEN